MARGAGAASLNRVSKPREHQETEKERRAQSKRADKKRLVEQKRERRRLWAERKAAAAKPPWIPK